MFNYFHTLRSPQMLTPDRMPVEAGKKTANILKKYPWGPLQLGVRFSIKISPAKKITNDLTYHQEKQIY